MCYSSSCVSKTRSRPRGVYLGLSATHRGRYMPKSRGTGKPANPSPPGRKSVQGTPRSFVGRGALTRSHNPAPSSGCRGTSRALLLNQNTTACNAQSTLPAGLLHEPAVRGPRRGASHREVRLGLNLHSSSSVSHPSPRPPAGTLAAASSWTSSLWAAPASVPRRSQSWRVPRPTLPCSSARPSSTS